MTCIESYVVSTIIMVCLVSVLFIWLWAMFLEQTWVFLIQDYCLKDKHWAHCSTIFVFYLYCLFFLPITNVSSAGHCVQLLSSASWWMKGERIYLFLFPNSKVCLPQSINLLRQTGAHLAGKSTFLCFDFINEFLKL